MFIGVYKAVYAYTAQTDQELSLKENDMLYLLEKADDGWWTVKRRVPGATSEEPQGIVPHNYVEPANAVGSATALFPYSPQTDEELGFTENDHFTVFAEDGDWILVGLKDKFGFVPANYISINKGMQAVPANQHERASSQTHSISSSLDRSPLPEPISHTEEDAPPRPARPSQHDRNKSLPEEPRLSSNRPSKGRNRSGSEVSRASSSAATKEVDWNVVEINGRRKVDRILTTAPTEIILSGGDSDETTWEVKNLISYSSEKKHVFLEFQHPRASLDFKLSSQDQADRLVAILGQMAGAVRGGGGLNEVMVAANSAGHKQGRVALDFKAANGREVSAREGETVFVLNTSNKDWWQVRTSSGNEGLIPRSFVELEPESRTLTSRLGLRRSAERQEKKEREERERERAKLRQEREDGNSSSDRLRRSQSTRSTRGHSSSDKSHKSYPDSRKVREWVDRSGQFRVEAALLGTSDGKIHLHKVNGVKIAVPAKKLSTPDLEYVESVTGMSLDNDKPLVTTGKQQSSRSSEPQSSRNTATDSGYDWFGFFLECGVDVHNCNRYAANFTRDRMDESVLTDITPSVLRTLGLREGDILRVTKKLNEKFNRAPTGGLFGTQDGALTDNSGNAVANSVQAVAAPSQQPPTAAAPAAAVAAPPVAQPVQQPQVPTPSAPPAAPAAPLNPPTGALADLLGYPTLSPQKTAAGPPPVAAMSQLQLQQPASNGIAPAATGNSQQPNALLAQLTSTQKQQQAQILRQQAELQQEQIKLLKAQQEQLRQQQDELKKVQTGLQTMRTGPLGPFATGVAGLQSSLTGAANIFGPSQPVASVLAAPPPPQPRQFVPNNVTSLQQPNLLGAQPQVNQRTGPFQAQATGPFQVSAATGSFPAQATGPFQAPAAAPFPAQATGPFQAAATGPFAAQATGPFQAQATGPFAAVTTGVSQPQASGVFPSQPTGPFQAQQRTGSFLPQTTFQSQGANVQPGVQYHTTGPFQSQPTGPFQSQPTGPFQSQPTGPFQSQSIKTPQLYSAQPSPAPQSMPYQVSGNPAANFQTSFPQPTVQQGFQPQTQFTGMGTQPGQMNPTSQIGQPSAFGAQQTGPFASAAPSFTGYGQTPNPSFGSMPMNTFNQNMNGSAFAGLPAQRTGTTFPTAGGATAGGFQAAPLQSQATGFGFGNQPQPNQGMGQNFQPGQQRPNISVATASNPFGF